MFKEKSLINNYKNLIKELEPLNKYFNSLKNSLDHINDLVLFPVENIDDLLKDYLSKGYFLINETINHLPNDYDYSFYQELVNSKQELRLQAIYKLITDNYQIAYIIISFFSNFYYKSKYRITYKLYEVNGLGFYKKEGEQFDYATIRSFMRYGLNETVNIIEELEIFFYNSNFKIDYSKNRLSIKINIPQSIKHSKSTKRSNLVVILEKTEFIFAADSRIYIPQSTFLSLINISKENMNKEIDFILTLDYLYRNLKINLTQELVQSLRKAKGLTDESKVLDITY